MTQSYYEIQCYGEGHEQDFTYYLQSGKRLDNDGIIEKLMTEHVGVNGLELHHVNNIVRMLPVSAQEFTDGCGIETGEPKPSNKFEDAILAIRDHGWDYHNLAGIRKLLVPPEGDERRMWGTQWDEYGFPNWMPSFSTNGNVDTPKKDCE